MSKLNKLLKSIYMKKKEGIRDGEREREGDEEGWEEGRRAEEKGRRGGYISRSLPDFLLKTICLNMTET